MSFVAWFHMVRAIVRLASELMVLELAAQRHSGSARERMNSGLETPHPRNLSLYSGTRSLAAMEVPCLDRGALGTDQRDPPVE
jgi:hypothetical protein